MGREAERRRHGRIKQQGKGECALSTRTLFWRTYALVTQASFSKRRTSSTSFWVLQFRISLSIMMHTQTPGTNSVDERVRGRLPPPRDNIRHSPGALHPVLVTDGCGRVKLGMEPKLGCLHRFQHGSCGTTSPISFPRKIQGDWVQNDKIFGEVFVICTFDPSVDL